LTPLCPDHPKTTPRSPQDHAKITPRPRQGRPLKKYLFLIGNADFSLEKCAFEATKGVLHYVLRREIAILKHNDNFEVDKCVTERGGRTALQPEASMSLKC